MSAKTAKQMRRDVRRAVGEDTITLIGEISTAIAETIFPAINDHGKMLRAMNERLTTVEAMLVRLQGQLHLLDVRESSAHQPAAVPPAYDIQTDTIGPVNGSH